MTDSSQTLAGLEQCIIKRRDGIYVEPMAVGKMLQGAIGALFTSNYLAGLDYPMLAKALYDIGPAFPRAPTGEPLIRIAADIVPFDAERRSIYRAVKIADNQAEYTFEPVFLPDPRNPDGMGQPAFLNVDEFVADMWAKGIRAGLDIAAISAAIASGKTERVVVARRVDPVPGQDAQIVEVSDDLHRSDAPRQLPNGKLDLMSFQNRFPQIKQGARLLQKLPSREGQRGYEMSGIPIEPADPKDVDMQPLVGEGTTIQRSADGEYIVAVKDGFLNVDTGSGQISVGDKIVSREGVSSRTTGNLQLTGDFEEFGEVQEKRVVEGESITIHADVFGNVVSRGGTVLLNRNLVGGSAANARGDIRIKGVASGATVQAVQGEVVMNRAENCIISGTRVTIDHAVNCEIMADELTIRQAEGCAVAARSVTIETAGPRRQIEMVVYALMPDNARVDEVIGLMRARVADFERLAAQKQAEMDELTNQPEVRKYVVLASKVRKKEIVLTPEQVPQFQKMALAVGPQLKAIGKVSLEVKDAQTERDAGNKLLAELVEHKNSAAGVSRVAVTSFSGDVTVRVLPFNPDGSSVYHLPPKDIKLRLRTVGAGGEVLYAGSNGPFTWSSAEAEAAAV
ncbi:DUF342 domain-containing protein [Massilia arenosa]|uniref:DUF342 domain-containing protein n=1 Tax=Zemynaea arenosa TaxID=2561931 RepID=A0A4Y9SV86_9BURK|nr:flagellar assembly protein A [Massilia arenosa]TFW28563.1 DUF342 domain-containing protein [Massilia arenosa]